jgi:CheY-like chemotaxis protein
MAKVRILIVDPDEPTRKSISASLQPRGYEFNECANGNEAILLVQTFVPDIIILEPDIAGMSGPELVRNLRTNAETALIPVIFLAPRAAVEEQIRGYGLGADDYVTKPVDAQELDLRIAVALKVREKTEAAIRPKQAPDEGFSIPGMMVTFRGSLDQIGLPTLLSLFDMERKTGMLVLILEPEKDKTRLWFNEGRLLRAAIDGKDAPKNLELVYSILGRNQGKFDFRPAAIPQSDEIGMPTAMLLLEGARLMDEIRRRGDSPA